MAAASQTLSRLTKSLSFARGIEKNLLAKEYIKSIFYSKESIQINLFYSLESCAGEKEKTLTKSQGFSIKKENRSPLGLSSNYIIPIIIPNTMVRTPNMPQHLGEIQTNR